MDVLLDTNLLARCIQPSHPLYGAATNAMKEFSARNDRLFIVPQVLYEYFVVCTRPSAEYGGLGMTNEAAIAEIARACALFELLPDSPLIYTVWLDLVGQYKVLGKRAHDARLVAAMEVHGLRNIATFNERDFSRFQMIQVISPHDLAAAWTARMP